MQQENLDDAILAVAVAEIDRNDVQFLGAIPPEHEVPRIPLEPANLQALVDPRIPVAPPLPPHLAVPPRNRQFNIVAAGPIRNIRNNLFRPAGINMVEIEGHHRRRLNRGLNRHHNANPLDHQIDLWQQNHWHQIPIIENGGIPQFQQHFNHQALFGMAHNVPMAQENRPFFERNGVYNFRDIQPQRVGVNYCLNVQERHEIHIIVDDNEGNAGHLSIYNGYILRNNHMCADHQEEMRRLAISMSICGNCDRHHFPPF